MQKDFDSKMIIRKMIPKKIKKFLRKNYLKFQSAISSKELAKLGEIYKTDKIDKWHSFSGKSYMDIYSIYFNPIKDEKITLLEIGIKGGASLRAFKEFFKNGKILGLDIDPGTAFTDSRITTYVGSQDSSEVIKKIFDEHPLINIVLDDGSHVNKLTIASFQLIFDKLPRGSLYIIEDLACSYLEDSLQERIKIGNWPGMHFNDPSVQFVNRRTDMNNLFLKLIREMDERRGEVEFVHFWSQMCIIKKID